MKSLFLFAILIFSNSSMSFEVTTGVYTSPLPTNLDSLDIFVEVARTSTHELTHVIQQRKSEIDSIIANTKDLNLSIADGEWIKLILSLIKDGQKVDLTSLSNFILREAFFNRAPELFQLAKEYGETKEQVDHLNKKQEVLMDQLIKCKQNSRCMAPLKVEIVSTQKELDIQTLLRNNLFSELDTASQPESEGIQLLSNISKNRHESAMTSIRNIK